LFLGIINKLALASLFLFSLTAAQANTVCFSPVEKCDTILVNFIKSATDSLDIAIYSLTLSSVSQAIIEMDKKVTVRVIVDKGQSSGSTS
jgi:hypothetical protein